MHRCAFPFATQCHDAPSLETVRRNSARPHDAGGGARGAPPCRRRHWRAQKRIRRLTGRAVRDFGMIADGDLVMACLSGGADSYTMLDTLLHMQRIAPIRFEIVAVNLDQKQPGFPEHVLPDYLAALRRALPHRRAGHLPHRQGRRSPRARRPARCAPGCAAASSTAPRANSAPPRSRSATTATTSSRRCC